MATVPLGYLKESGIPFGMTVIAREHAEDVLLRFMSVWEATFPPRQVPRPLTLSRSTSRVTEADLADIF